MHSPTLDSAIAKEILKIDLKKKTDKTDAVINGSISMGRAENSVVGQSSIALGADVVASGIASSAVGGSCQATNVCAHAEGASTHATGTYSHAENAGTTASGAKSHAEGERSVASGDVSHAEGYWTASNGACSHSEGSGNTANGICSHAEGYKNTAAGADQHVQGKWAITDNSGVFCHIVGNGTDNDHRSNAHTVDWNGNAEYAGDVKANACGGQNPVSLVAVASEVATKQNKLNLQLIEAYDYDFDTATQFERTLTPEGDAYNFDLIAIEIVVNPSGTIGNYGIIYYLNQQNAEEAIFECGHVLSSEYKSHLGGLTLPIGDNLMLPIQFASTNTGNPNTLASKSHYEGDTITHFRQVQKWKGVRVKEMFGTGTIRIYAGNMG